MIVETVSPKALPRPIKGAVAFEDVSFRYPTRADSLALDKFDLSVAPGETVAIVGPSGAGKTTVFNLLLRFYDPDQGRVTFHGIDLKDARRASLYAQTGVVFQDNFLFADSIRENIRLGRPGATDQEVENAALLEREASDSRLRRENRPTLPSTIRACAWPARMAWFPWMICMSCFWASSC